MTTVRLRTDEDIPACHQVLCAVYKVSGYPVEGVDDPAPYFNHGGIAWIAENDGIVAGHIAITKAATENVAVALWSQLHPEDANLAITGRLFVNPINRKGGTASRLIDTAVEEARRRGQRLLMFCLIKDQNAIRLYRKLGWQHYGITTFKWEENSQMAAECFAYPPL
ncbi:hypothetical protein M426DRAFT_248956 [Hypoxylon sp. CI-4A]|nr:hypothetical protein M426DRAFT_248956 [Hypoxylon sp. CI-4A]